MTDSRNSSGEAASDRVAVTALCPQGHVNAANYKFCSQCGVPIGVLPFPADDEIPDTAQSWGGRRALLIGGVVLALVVAAAGVAGAVLVVRSGTDKPAAAPDGGFTTSGVAAPAACAEPPILAAESMDMTPAGLTVAAAFFPGCAGGEVEAGNAVRVTVADGRRDIAAGEFDFSAAPVVMDGGAPGHQTLVFPSGMYWRTPDMVDAAPTLVAHRAQNRPGLATAAVGRQGVAELTATAPASPEHGSVDGVAQAVLNELRDADYPYVRNIIANRWVPQVSSKRAGLEIKGRELTNADVLTDHLAYRQRYGEARLVYSGQWSTFSGPDWWVTVVGPSWYFPADANRWCDSEGFGVDDCFAKFVSSMFGAEEGTTVYRK
ncbi:hypothetical protein SBI67_20515 [Mycolicibacterium sp. 120266]|uniref:hypothetical protein n=1 Tax=Mycolicibacterium sp. 120266 TaxID=3090601 RepID=UPI00299CE0C7|nr:hypothetical protein [Mycolicibacterium sp. 120266]MDX1874510.1 hypothetical protein [Mycolicibacterium sp. 120266]